MQPCKIAIHAYTRKKFEGVCAGDGGRRISFSGGLKVGRNCGRLCVNVNQVAKVK